MFFCSDLQLLLQNKNRKSLAKIGKTQENQGLQIDLQKQ
jgi:hypothetical protein